MNTINLDRGELKSMTSYYLINGHVQVYRFATHHEYRFNGGKSVLSVGTDVALTVFQLNLLANMINKDQKVA